MRPPGAPFDWLFLITDQAPAGLAELLQRMASLVKPDGAMVLAIGRIFSEAELSSVAEPSGLVSPSAA